MVMPNFTLDRVATLIFGGDGERNIHGEWEAAAAAETPIWGALKLAEFQDMLMGGGARRQSSDLEFVTRYRADLLAAETYEDWRLTLDGVDYQITSAEEMPKYGRRRYMLIEGVYST